MHKLQIMLADDHPMYRGGVRNIINNEEAMVVIGETTTGDEAVRLALELSPDIILMDIRMPGLNGNEATAPSLTIYLAFSISYPLRIVPKPSKWLRILGFERLEFDPLISYNPIYDYIYP